MREEVSGKGKKPVIADNCVLWVRKVPRVEQSRDLHRGRKFKSGKLILVNEHPVAHVCVVCAQPP